MIKKSFLLLLLVYLYILFIEQQHSGRCWTILELMVSSKQYLGKCELIISQCEHLYKTETLSVFWSGALRFVLTQHQGGKTAGKHLLLPINLGKVKTPFQNNLKSIQLSTVRKVIHKRKTFKTTAHRWDDTMLRETGKNQRATSQTLQTSVSMLIVHDSAIRRRLNKYSLFGLPGEHLSLKGSW